jgi:hypothetical protein
MNSLQDASLSFIGCGVMAEAIVHCPKGIATIELSIDRDQNFFFASMHV